MTTSWPDHLTDHLTDNLAEPSAGSWADALADALLGWALELNPGLAAPLQAALHRCVAQLERERGAGHVCLALGVADAARLRASGLVEDDPTRAQGRPLVIDAAGLLYLQRDHEHERRLAERIAALRAAAPQALAEQPLRALFPPQAGAGIDWQAVAVAQALRQRLTVISGGPGTGKTSTVVKLLACVLAQQPAARIALAAPTGKAAQRLLEALREGAQRLDLHELTLPAEALTVHRLLGAGPQGFRHGAGRPLALDWLVVDEASMLDLALARQLFDALGADTRLVLLGDRHQLAAVENGAVLAELSRTPCWSSDASRALTQALGQPLALPEASGDADLPDLAVSFERSHRFDAASGIGRLAALLREGAADAAVALLAEGAADLAWRPTASAAALDALLDEGLSGYAQALSRLWQQPGDAALEDAVWRAWDAFRLLCAGHAGPWGTRALNQRAVQALRRALPQAAPTALGQALLVTRNQAPFVNGDILLLLPTPGAGPLQAQLRRGAQRLVFAPQQLPAELDGAFALTVHKAQGSEFDRALLLLPERQASPSRPSRPSREWLYTGATRARRRLELLASEAALRAAIAAPTERRSGLRAALAALS